MSSKDIFSFRLKAARKMAGLSMDDLVRKMDLSISKSAIGKYENGKMLPNSENLIAISNALGVNSDYFFRPIKYRLSNIEFRKKSKLPKSEQERVKELVQEYTERYFEIEEILNKKITFSNPIIDNIINKEDIERTALELRKNWNLGESPILNLSGLLEEKGFIIFESEFSGNFDGLSAWADGIPVIFLNKKSDAVRKRFTVLHELAHLILKFPDDIENSNKEKLCHSFAGAFLIPANILKYELGEKRHRLTFQELIAIKETYGISIQALIKRANLLGIISDNYYEQFFILIRKNHLQDEKSLGNYTGIEKTSRFIDMIYYAVAEGIITLSKGANLAGEPLSEFRNKLAG